MTLLRKDSKYRRDKTTIVDIFDKTVAKHPNKTAILFEKQKWTFARLQGLTYQVANYFSSKGFKEGDCVAIYLHNCSEYVGLWLGLSRIGVSSALINYNLKTDVLCHTITVSNAKAVICSAELSPFIAEIHVDLECNLGKDFSYYCLDGSAGNLNAIDLLHELYQIEKAPPRARSSKCYSGV